MCVCVLKPLGPIPRSSGRWSPRSAHSRGLYWHPAVGCVDIPSLCEWADASQAAIPMACKDRTRAWAPRAHRDQGHLCTWEITTSEHYRHFVKDKCNCKRIVMSNDVYITGSAVGNAYSPGILHDGLRNWG